MKVAIFNTKPSTKNNKLIEHLESGINKTDSATIVPITQLGHIKKYDAVIMTGAPVVSGVAWAAARKTIANICKGENKPYGIIDVGYINKERETYWVLGLNGFKNFANFGEIKENYDRLESFDIDVKPWRTEGGNILVLGQNPNGFLKAKPQSFMKEYVEWGRLISRETKKKVYFKAHPMAPLVPKGINGLNIKEISKALNNAWSTITKSSNAAIDSIVQGVPCVVTDKACICYDYYQHDILDTIEPITFDRQPMLARIADIQYTIKEFGEGLPWQRIRDYV